MLIFKTALFLTPQVDRIPTSDMGENAFHTINRHFSAHGIYPYNTVHDTNVQYRGE